MNFLIVVLAYVICHALMALFVTPIQSALLPELTVFASLLYLPHGVRVLATWAFGWRAIPALIVGVSISAWLFRPSAELDLLEPALVQSILVGETSAFLAFELARLLGFDFYQGRAERLNWKGMIMIRALSSVINSIGQTIVHSGLIGLGQLMNVLAIYAFGDLMGVVACMVLLMFIFRWHRWYHLTRRQ